MVYLFIDYSYCTCRFCVHEDHDRLRQRIVIIHNDNNNNTKLIMSTDFVFVYMRIMTAFCSLVYHYLYHYYYHYYHRYYARIYIYIYIYIYFIVYTFFIRRSCVSLLLLLLSLLLL